jgi:hypothetical protein
MPSSAWIEAESAAAAATFGIAWFDPQHVPSWSIKSLKARYSTGTAR